MANYSSLQLSNNYLSWKSDSRLKGDGAFQELYACFIKYEEEVFLSLLYYQSYFAEVVPH